MDETMTNEMINEVPEMINEASSVSGVGLGVLIGSGLTLAAIAGGKKLWSVWKKHKASKTATKEINGAKPIDVVEAK